MIEKYMKYKSYLFFMSFYNMIMMMITKGEITQLILIVNFPQSIFITVHLWFYRINHPRSQQSKRKLCQ